jgi:hypothetical protein
MAESSKKKRPNTTASKAAKNKPAQDISKKTVAATSPAKTKEPEVVVHRTSSEPSQPSIASRVSGIGGKVKPVLTDKTFWKWVGAVLATLLILLFAWWQWQRSYVATVNGQYIATTELHSQLMANYGSQTLDTLTQQQLILQEADKRNVTIDESAIQSELNSFIETTGGEDSYRNSLREFGISEQLLRTQISVRLTLEKLLADKIKVSEKEIEEYYNTNKAEIDPENRGLDTVRESISIQLKEQKLNEESSSFLESIGETAEVTPNLNHASLTFGDFLKDEVLSIPTDVWNLFAGNSAK